VVSDLAPGADRVMLGLDSKANEEWKRFEKKHRAEMNQPENGAPSSYSLRFLITAIFRWDATVETKHAATDPFCANYSLSSAQYRQVENCSRDDVSTGGILKNYISVNSGGRSAALLEFLAAAAAA
jgi:hypothetical protein